MTPPKILFSVVQETAADGTTSLSVDWHPDLYDALDVLSPDGQMTDRIIDMTDELLHALDEETEIVK